MRQNLRKSLQDQDVNQFIMSHNIFTHHIVFAEFVIQWQVEQHSKIGKFY